MKYEKKNEEDDGISNQYEKHREQPGKQARDRLNERISSTFKCAGASRDKARNEINKGAATNCDAVFVNIH